METTSERQDGWQNLITKLGTPEDKRVAASIVVEKLRYRDLVNLYRGDDSAARIVDTLPEEMCREGFSVVLQDKDVGEATSARLDELDALAKLQQALQWKRAYGGAGIILGANDGQDPSLPLRIERVRSLDWLNVLDANELIPETYYENAQEARYGEPKTYRVQPTFGTGQHGRVHESRVIRFNGVVASRLHLQDNNGWGDSVMVRVLAVIRDFQAAWDGASHLLADFSQAVFEIEGLREAFATKSEELITNRLRYMNQARSILRAIIIEKGESFERKTTPLSGLDTLLDKFCLRLAAAASLPVTMLMGQAPAGLNATGASDTRWFYDRVKAEQTKTLRPAINQLLKVLFAAKNGPTRGQEPENWSVKFNPLWQLDDLQSADLRVKQSQADRNYIEAGVLQPEEVALSRFGADGYNTDTTVDLDARRELLENPEPPPTEPEPEQPEAAGADEIEQDLPEDDAEPEAKQDFDPDQPRDEDGKWGAGGGGGGGAGANSNRPAKPDRAAYEKGKETYWRERNVREKAFAAKLAAEGKEMDWNAFAKSEKPFIKQFQAQHRAR